jgi:PAS domain S-box-containing protein
MTVIAAAESTQSHRVWPEELEFLPLPCIEIDAAGIVTRANRAARALHHPVHGDLVGKLGWDFMAADERDLSHAEFFAQIQSGGDPPVITRNIFDRSGSFRTYQFHRSLIRGVDGHTSGMRIVAVDMTEMSQALDEAQRSLRWLENAMNSMADAVVLTDILGVIRSLNPAAEAIAGAPAEQLVGMPIEEALPLVSNHSPDGAPLDHRTTITRHWNGTATLLNRRREEVSVAVSTWPMYDKSNGSTAGIVAILRKI